MQINELKYLCKAMAKYSSAGVRLYQGEELLYYYSVYYLEPDPVIPYLPEILADRHQAGVFTTPLFQFYGHVRMKSNICVIVGPTCVPAEDLKKLEELMFLLDVPGEAKAEYSRKLCGAPSITAECMGWLMSFLVTAAEQRPFPIEEVYVGAKGENHRHTVAKANAVETLRTAEDEEVNDVVRDSYRYEKVIVSHIENGQAEQLREIFSATPPIRAGEMAKDTLRQVKNMVICSATVSSRAAVMGGLDHHTAFRLSDLYIQKIEMLSNPASIVKLMNEMMVDFAERVQQIKYGCDNNSALFQKCSRYVSENIFHEIRVEDIAEEFHLSRAYLCNQFRRLTGTTLSQYIQNEKIHEAQRLLCFTDRTLAEIASQLSFSSQSYFQNVFKKISGMTPTEYRKKNK